MRLLALSLILTSCMNNLFQSSLDRSGSGSNQNINEKRTFVEENYESSFGLKTFEGIYYSMERLTGVVNDNTVKGVYNNVRSGLPVDNQLTSFTDSVQKSVTLLASGFCDRLVLNQTRLRAILGSSFNSSGGKPSQAEAQTIIDSFVEKFYGASESEDVKEDAKQEYAMMLEDLMNLNDSSINKQDYIFAVCTASLASLPVIME